MEEPELPPKIHRFAPWRWPRDEQIGCALSLIMFGIIGGFALFMFFGAINARSPNWVIRPNP